MRAFIGGAEKKSLIYGLFLGLDFFHYEVAHYGAHHTPTFSDLLSCKLEIGNFTCSLNIPLLTLIIKSLCPCFDLLFYGNHHLLFEDNVLNLSLIP